MIAMDDLEGVKRRVEALRRAADEANGTYAHLMKRLKEKYGCDTIKEAEALLEEKVAAEEKARDRYVRALTKFKAEYKKQLDG